MSDISISGTKSSKDLGVVTENVVVEGVQNSLKLIVPKKGSISVEVEGTRCSVTIDGKGEVDVTISGTRSSVTVAERTSVVGNNDTGTSNSFSREKKPLDIMREEDNRKQQTGEMGRENVEDDVDENLIETTREEAYSSTGWFGYEEVSFQEPVEEDTCKFCGEETSMVVQRFQRRLLVVFGLTYIREEYTSHTCPNCHRPSKDDITFDDWEKEKIYR